MARASGNQFNRAVVVFETGANIASTAVSVTLKADPSQQFNIYGVSAAYVYNTIADANAWQTGYVVGYLGYTGSFNTDTIDGVFADVTLGEIFYFGFIERVAQGALNIPYKEDISNPIIINADRIITFILSPPQGAGVAGNIRLYLEIRGEVTQVDTQEKPRLGKWQLR